MRCEGCGTDMQSAPRPEAAKEPDALSRWTCPRCASWCLTDEDNDVVMAAWLLDGREWPH